MRYLKQAIVLRKDLCMPGGKAAAMAAHAAMTFLLKGLHRIIVEVEPQETLHGAWLTDDQARWLTELDPGIESTSQVSMAKIVLAATDEEHLASIEQAAQTAGLTVHRVIDSGHSHNPTGTFVGIAIGPHWPEDLEPVTGGLKLYR